MATIFLAASPVFKGLSLMPAVGNHDDEELFRQFFALPQNGPKGYEETFYSFDYGNCHIAVLNSNSMGIPGVGDYDKIVKWLKDDLKSSRQLWKFLVFHHPPYPVVEDWRAEHLQTNWVPIFEECGVDMIFVGHQHVYMRTKPICGGQVQSDGEGIVYVMGNSGTKYYAEGPDYDYIAKQLAWVSNYQVVEIDGKTLTLTARDADGNIIDTYSFTKQETDDKAQFNVVPVPNDVYTIGKTQDGICKMTVNEGQSGFKYFTVSIEPVVSHEGEETVVFTHIRTGKQIGLSATVADFDLVKGAQAGLHVNPGDIIKVFVIDKLTSDLDCNPIILQ
ncbi:MAG: metallophosphoesterase family protein [Tepidanaerobacteraceae bacterium]